jgi:hypothetical protein
LRGFGPPGVTHCSITVGALFGASVVANSKKSSLRLITLTAQDPGPQAAGLVATRFVPGSSVTVTQLGFVSSATTAIAPRAGIEIVRMSQARRIQVRHGAAVC